MSKVAATNFVNAEIQAVEYGLKKIADGFLAIESQAEMIIALRIETPKIDMLNKKLKAFNHFSNILEESDNVKYVVTNLMVSGMDTNLINLVVSEFLD